MGSITSGSYGWRGGKQSSDRFPVVRLTHAETFTLKQRLTYVRIEGPEHGTVIHGERNWPVGFGSTPLHFGGTRRWLVCPCCNSRREALYIANTLLACRTCLKLRYESNHESKRDRMFRRVEKIRRKLKWQPGIAHGITSKPAKMHSRTYFALVREHEALSCALLGLVSKWVDAAEVMLSKESKHYREVATDAIGLTNQFV